MALPCRLLLAGLFTLLMAAPATAQRRGRLDCPRPARQRTYRPPPAIHIEIAAGMSKPLMYANDGGSLGGHCRFSSLALPYLSAGFHLALGDKLGLFTGISATQTWQGLRADYTYGNTSFRQWGYTGSFTIRAPLGITYRLSPALRLDAAPYISYSTHSDYQYGDANAGGSGQGFYYTFESPEDKGRINFGFSMALQLRLGHRLGLEALCAADARSATPSYSIAYAAGSAIDEARLSPRLLQIGLGLCYRLWQ